MYPSGLRELTQLCLVLAEQARRFFEAFEFDETDRSSVEDHVWFANTALCCAWVGGSACWSGRITFSLFFIEATFTLWAHLFGGRAGGGRPIFCPSIAGVIYGSLYLQERSLQIILS